MGRPGDNIKVSQFLEENQDSDSMVPLLQDYLLGALKSPALVGKYSIWWENSIYSKGYTHDETVRLAYL